MRSTRTRSEYSTYGVFDQVRVLQKVMVGQRSQKSSDLLVLYEYGVTTGRRRLRFRKFGL